MDRSVLQTSSDTRAVRRTSVDVIHAPQPRHVAHTQQLFGGVCVISPSSLLKKCEGY